MRQERISWGGTKARQNGIETCEEIQKKMDSMERRPLAPPDISKIGVVIKIQNDQRRTEIGSEDGRINKN